MDIYSYSDFRTYLKDFYESRKAHSPNFSFRYLAQKAGINSSSFYKHIFDGSRNLTKSTILKTCHALKLDDLEAEYFEVLVFFCQAKTLKEKNQFFKKLITLQQARNIKKIEINNYAYFEKWHHCVVRELVTMLNFPEDYEKLGKMVSPAISARDAKDSVKLLLELGFLKRRDGILIQNEPLIATGPSIHSVEVIRFQIAMLQLAIQSFENINVKNRYTSSTTFSISQTNFNAFVKKIRSMKSSLMELARIDNSPEQVYQLNLNLFPVSKPTRRGQHE